MSDEEIRAVNTELMEAVAEGRAEAAAALYSEDAYVLAPGGELLDGRDAIAGFFRRTRADGVARLVLNSEHLDTIGDQAAEVGRYSLLGETGQELDAGRYLVVWKRRGGRWLLYRDAIVPARA